MISEGVFPGIPTSPEEYRYSQSGMEVEFVSRDTECAMKTLKYG